MFENISEIIKKLLGEEQKPSINDVTAKVLEYALGQSEKTVKYNGKMVAGLPLPLEQFDAIAADREWLEKNDYQVQNILIRRTPPTIRLYASKKKGRRND